eukprot:9967121-Lingulodinium_polyedra.AAC.1
MQLLCTEQSVHAWIIAGLALATLSLYIGGKAEIISNRHIFLRQASVDSCIRAKVTNAQCGRANQGGTTNS